MKTINCSKHGVIDESKCYIWKSKGKERLNCKLCAKERRAKKYKGKVPRCVSSLDWTGKKYNWLTFIKPTEKRKRGAVIWELRCDCGIHIERVAHYIVRSLTTSCGCQTSTIRAKLGAKTRKYSPRISSARSIWRRVYKDGCKFEDFLKLSQKSCHYCGKEPERIFNLYSKFDSHPLKDEADFKYNGLDRIDSDKDHSLNNIVPCCTDCNIMKNNKSVQEFLDHIKAIYLHQINHNSNV